MSRDEMPAGSEEPLYNSRLITNYLAYLKKNYPDIDRDALLTMSGITNYEVEDEGHWFTQGQVNRFNETVTRATGNLHISKDVGRSTAQSEASGALRQYVLGFLNPFTAYWMLEKQASTLSRGFTLKTRQIGTDRVEVKVIPRPGVKERLFQCENRQGIFEAVGRLFSNQYANIEHPLCIHRGDDCCLYWISWEKPPSFLWKRLWNYSTLFVVLLYICLFFVLPPVTWSMSVVLLSVYLVLLTLFYGHISKKELIETIQKQGDAAKRLLDEMNMRHNNALLVQEIGQATSMVLDIENLLKTVAESIRKRLDFDRCMIMLSDAERTRLIYVAGYGYNPAEEEILAGTEFHLDRAESQGIFVRAYREQKPFLINDIKEIQSGFSSRSQELAKMMGVRSLVLAPIVYEKGSLGILAVDNVESKRPLTVSDMSLLMGVASQAAVSIVNAMSYRRLQESEKKYRDLVETANSIILRMDKEGTIVFFNEFGQKFFGYSASEISGKNVKGTIFPDTNVTATDMDLLNGSLQTNPERRVVREIECALRSGKKAWVAWTHRPVFDEQGRLSEILCIGNDITDLKRSAQEKKDLETQLQQAQKMEAIGTLAGGISHDFNNLLQVISGHTEVMKLNKDPGHPDYERLDIISKSVRRAGDLTGRLMIFSRRVKSRFEPTDLNQTVVQVAKMLERIIPKMIEISLHLSASLMTINADPAQIEQIILNLAINARDAMPDGGRLVFSTENTTLGEEFCKHHFGVSPGEYVLLSVSDTGHGMHQEVVDHIFEPFFTTKEVGKGTGLGLAIVYGSVNNHGGCILCESNPGAGTAFRVFLPAIRKKKEKEEIEEEIQVRGGHETILIVDDEEHIRDIGKETLTKMGYTVLTAEDGKSALEVYRDNRFRIALVLLDLVMPGMSGIKCLEKLLEIDPAAKVLIASGYMVEGYQRDVIDKHSKGFIEKPFRIRDMLQTVRQVLDGM